MLPLLRDLRHTLRGARRSPRLFLAAAACIALGVGGAVFILTIADAVLRKGPPFPDADRLVRIWTFREDTRQRTDVSYLEAREIAAAARSFDAVEMTARTRTAIITAAGAERVRGESVTPGYFELIGLQPAAGRLFTADEYAPDAPRVMIIGYALWQRAFGGRSDILGLTVRARGNTGRGESEERFTIVGVMPSGFAGTIDPDISEFWLPIEQYTPRVMLGMRRARSTWVLARLRPDASVAAAHAEVSAIGRQMAAEHPDDYRELALGVEPLGETWRERFRAGITLVTSAAGLLLLIGCVNVAWLLLTRLAQREGELRLRAMLGASRATIVRQLALESVVITAIGGAAGALLAMVGVRVFARAEVFRLPAFVPLEVDAGIVSIALALVLLTALLAGVLPAWLASRLTAARGLREVGRGTTMSRRQRRLIDGLVASEVAFAFVLLTGTLLMVRTYANLVGSDLGYRVEGLQRMAISLDPAIYPSAAEQIAFTRTAREALMAQSGVAGVSFLSGVLPPWVDDVAPIAVAGVPRPELAATYRHPVDEHFFDVMDIGLEAGRAFRASDDTAAHSVAIVSRSLARAVAGGDGRAAVGRAIQVGRDAQALERAPVITIVGVAKDVRYHGPLGGREMQYDLYVPMAQQPGAILSIAIATTHDPARVLGTLQRTLGRLAPTSPLHWISSMEEELGIQYADARLYAWLTGVFGGSGLLLVAIGIHGVIANGVTRRRGELGIRMAIGARPRDIVTLIVSQGSRPLLLGIVVGVLVALAAAQLAVSLVHGVAATDPATYAAVGVLLLGVGLVACWLPAWRASRVAPTRMLREI